MTSTTFPNEETIDIRGTEPFWFRSAKRMQRVGVRGGYRLERLAAERLWEPRQGVAHQLSPAVELVVPIGTRSYDRFDVDHYEDSMVCYAAELLSSVGRPATLVDCGADFGMVSAKLLARCPDISSIVAIEPNPEVFGFLERNVASWPVDGRAVPAAAADWIGRGALQQPAFDTSAHAAFLVPLEGGEVEVVTIDSLALPVPQVLALKIDVEGGELAVVGGAADLLASAGDFMVLFEAHPRQSARVGIDPMDVVRELSRIARCRVAVTERPDLALVADRPFRDQVRDDRIYNLCVTTIGA